MSAARERFIGLLRDEILQVDAAELDFGIYRVLNYRRAELDRYLGEELPAQIARSLAQLPGDAAGEDEEARIYNALFTFFSRYYEDGDFMPRARRGKDGAYSVAYDGGDTFFHWATRGSHYVKSGERFASYAYVQPGGTRVRFTVTQAQVEKDNAKGAARYYVPATLAETDGEWRVGFAWRMLDAKEQSAWGGKSAKAATTKDNEDDEVDGTVEGKSPQDRILNAWIAAWSNGKASPFDAAKPPANLDRTLLEKYARRFVRGQQSDFFVHPQLGPFLNGELDYYLKNEFVSMWDLPDTALARERGKYRIVRELGQSIIRVLHALEAVQAALFEKRKFVMSAHYLVQCSRLAAMGENGAALVKQAAANGAQVAEWAAWVGETKRVRGPELLKRYPHLPLNTANFDEVFKWDVLACVPDVSMAIEGVLIQGDNYAALRLLEPTVRESVKCIYIDPPYNTGTDGFLYKDRFKHSAWLTMMGARLRSARSLMCETAAIYSSIDENERDALTVSLDNAFGAENRVEELVWEQNTTHSQSPAYSTNHEYLQVWAKNRLACEAEKAMFREPKPGYLEVMALIDEINAHYPSISEAETRIQALFDQHVADFRSWLASHGKEYTKETARLDPWRGIYNYKHVEYRDSNGKFVGIADARGSGARLWIWRESDPSAPAAKQSDTTRDPRHANFRFYSPLHAVTKKPCSFPKRGFAMPYEWPDDDRESFVQLQRDQRIVFGEDESKIPQFKRFLHDVESNVAQSVFSDYTDGEKELASLIGRNNAFDGTPKPTSIPAMCARQSNSSGRTVLDFFAGSGTTGHGVIALNREDGGTRKFVLVEQSNYFDALLKQRIAKVLASPDWKDGKPKPDVNHDPMGDPEHWSRRTPPLVQVLKIERYEDSLDALQLGESAQSAQATLTALDTLITYLASTTRAGYGNTQPVSLSTAKLTHPFDYRLPTVWDGRYAEQPVDMFHSALLLLGLHPVRVRRLVREGYAPGGGVYLLGEARPHRPGRGAAPLELLVLRTVDESQGVEALQVSGPAEYRWLCAAVQASFGCMLGTYALIRHNRDMLLLDGLAGESIDAPLALSMWAGVEAR